jgi:hypothetical protein
MFSGFPYIRYAIYFEVPFRNEVTLNRHIYFISLRPMHCLVVGSQTNKQRPTGGVVTEEMKIKGN